MPPTQPPPSKRPRSTVGHTTFLSLKADLASLQSRSPHPSPSPSSSTLPSSSTTTRLSSTFLPPHTSTSASKNRPAAKQKLATSSWSTTPSAQLDTIRANLERKARIYRRLERGLHGGVSREVREEGGVDWERKALERHQSVPSHDDDDNKYGDGEDEGDEWEGEEGSEIVEYVDDLGRTRAAPKRDIPLEYLPVSLGGHLPDPPSPSSSTEDKVLYGPATEFPVYRPPSPTLERRKLEREKERHFDPEWEKRHRGAAFYKFAKGEEERRRQMRQLEEERKRTVGWRREAGEAGEAGEKVGKAEGMGAKVQLEGGLRRGREKRKRSMQQRMEKVEEARRTRLGEDGVCERRKRIELGRLQALLPV